MTDIIKDFFSHLRERVRNVFYSSFLISWLIINWKPAYLVLKLKDPTVESLQNILNTYYAGAVIKSKGQFFLSKDYFYYLLLPFVVSIFHIFVLSKLSKIFYSRWLRDSIKLNELKNDIEKNKTLTLKESQLILKEISELRIKLNETEELHMKELNAIRETGNQIPKKGSGKLKNELTTNLSSSEEDEDGPFKYQADVNDRLIHPNSLSDQDKYLNSLINLKNSPYNIIPDTGYNEVEHAIKNGMTQVFFNNIIISRDLKAKIENYKNLAEMNGFTITSTWLPSQGSYKIENMTWRQTPIINNFKVR